MLSSCKNCTAQDPIVTAVSIRKTMKNSIARPFPNMSLPFDLEGAENKFERRHSSSASGSRSNLALEQERDCYFFMEDGIELLRERRSHVLRLKIHSRSNSRRITVGESETMPITSHLPAYSPVFAQREEPQGGSGTTSNRRSYKFRFSAGKLVGSIIQCYKP